MKKATVTVDPHFQVGTVDPRLFGSFLEHLGRAVYEGIYQPDSPLADEDGLRTDVIALVQELGVPIVRYPGGNFVSGYRWEDGVGPKAQRPARPDLAWHVIESNQFGLNEFMAWCQKAHIEPMMAVNLGTRGVEAAKHLVEYCNFDHGTYYSDLRRAHGVEKPYGIKVWNLGNEMDGAWQEGHKTAAEYGRIAAEAGRAMKMLDPNIELAACGSSAWKLPTFGAWEETVLDEAYDVVDYISLHQYYGNPDNNTADFLASSVSMDRFITEVCSLADAVKARKRETKTINLSFDEWNVWFHSHEADAAIPRWGQHPHQLEDVYNLEDALVVSSMLITLLRHADRVKIACLAQLVNVIAPIMTSDTGAWKQTIFYPFAIMSRYGRGTVLNTLISAPKYASKHGDAAYLDAVVVDNLASQGELSVFAVNKALDDDLRFKVDLRQFSELNVAVAKVLVHPDVKAVNTEQAPDTVQLVNADIAVLEDGALTVTLPAHSFGAVVLTGH